MEPTGSLSVHRASKQACRTCLFRCGERGLGHLWFSCHNSGFVLSPQYFLLYVFLKSCYVDEMCVLFLLRKKEFYTVWCLVKYSILIYVAHILLFSFYTLVYFTEPLLMF